MEKFSLIKIKDKKLYTARHYGVLFCLILGLLSSLFLLSYHYTYIIFQFDLGYTLLRLSIFFFVSVIICASAFDNIKSQYL